MNEEEKSAILGAISQAIEWLLNMTNTNSAEINEPSSSSTRVFNQEEYETIPTSAYSLLLILEQQGILTPLLRETVIHHAMELKTKRVDHQVIEGIARIVVNHQHDNPEILRQLDFLLQTYNQPPLSETVH